MAGKGRIEFVCALGVCQMLANEAGRTRRHEIEYRFVGLSHCPGVDAELEEPQFLEHPLQMMADAWVCPGNFGNQ